MRVCTLCEIEKDDNQFYKQNLKYYRSSCIDCCKKVRKNIRLEDEKYVARLEEKKRQHEELLIQRNREKANKITTKIIQELDKLTLTELFNDNDKEVIMNILSKI